MSIGVDDFLRILPAAIPLPETGRADGLVTFDGATVRYRVLPPLRLGALAIPVLAVELDFADEARLAHFDRMTQRGGG